MVGALGLLKNWGSHIDASHSRQPLVKGERLVRYEVNAVILSRSHGKSDCCHRTGAPPCVCACAVEGRIERRRAPCDNNPASRKPLPTHNSICYPKGCAATSSVQCQCNARGSLSKLAGVPPRRKINVTSKSPVGDISVVTLIRTDTTLDHSQKAEKV